MKGKITLLFCFVLSIWISSAHSMYRNEALLFQWKLHQGNGYTIQYPSDWELNQSKQMGTEFFLFSPLESSMDKFRENVNLLIQDLGGYNINLKKYAEMTEAQVKTMITNSHLLESKEMKSSKGTYHHMVYTGDQGEFSLQFEQYFWVKNEKAYILTFTTEKDKFKTYRETGILDSFEFTGK